MKDEYTVTLFGSNLATFPRTPEGLRAAWAFSADHRAKTGHHLTEIVNINRVDLGCEDGLTREERDTLDEFEHDLLTANTGF